MMMMMMMMSTIYDVTKYRGMPVSRYSSITVYYRRAFLDTAHPSVVIGGDGVSRASG